MIKKMKKAKPAKKPTTHQLTDSMYSEIYSENFIVQLTNHQKLAQLPLTENGTRKQFKSMHAYFNASAQEFDNSLISQVIDNKTQGLRDSKRFNGARTRQRWRKPEWGHQVPYMPICEYTPVIYKGKHNINSDYGVAEKLELYLCGPVYLHGPIRCCVAVLYLYRAFHCHMGPFTGRG